MLVGKIRVLAIILKRSGRQNLPAFHAEVILRAGERIVVPGLLDRAAGGSGSPESVGSAHRVGVETLVRSGVARFLAAVSQRKDNDAIGLAGQPPRGGGDFAVRKRNVDDVRINLAVLAATPGDVVRQLQLLRRLGADQRGIVPGELGDRLRQFLQPAVIGEAPVVDARIGAEEELNVIRGRGFCGGQAGNVEFQSGIDRWKRRACDDAIIQRFPPELFEIGRGIRGLQAVAQHFVIRDSRFVSESCERFTRGMRVIERRDQRLNHAERTVESARVAPGLEVVRFGDVPIAEFGSLVKMRADVNGILDGLPIFLLVEFNLGREIEIVRRVIDWIAPENQQRLDPAGIDIGA